MASAGADLTAQADETLFKKMMVRHRAKKQIESGVKNRHCYFYLSIDGENAWEESREYQEKIRLAIEEGQCRSLTIYKVIRNVSTVEKPQRTSGGYSYNLGLILEQDDEKVMNIDSTLVVESCDIATSYVGTDKLNAGVFVKDSPWDAYTGVPNREIINRTIIKDSSLGKVDYVDSGFDIFMEGKNERDN